MRLAGQPGRVRGRSTALQPDYCSGHHVVDPAYFDTRPCLPRRRCATCDNGHDNCVGYARWAQAWAGVTAQSG